MEAGADIELRVGKDQCYVLELAVIRGHIGILKAAVQHGASVDSVDSVGAIALHLAAYTNRVKAIDALVELAADVEAMDIVEGSTPLHTASFRDHSRAADALLRNEAFVDALDSKNRTPLFLATTTGDLDVARVLLSAGAVCSARPWDDDNSPLRVAILEENLDILAVMIKHGADVNKSECEYIKAP